MLNAECYLIVSATYGYSKRPSGLRLPRIVSAKSGKTPSLKPGEVAIKLSVSLPETLFQKPTLRAQITVDENSITAQTVDASVVNNIVELMQAEHGITLEIEGVGGVDE